MALHDKAQRLRIDGHLHIYEAYDWPQVVSSLIRNLSEAEPATSRSLGPQSSFIFLGLLAESRSCTFYRRLLAQGSLKSGEWLLKLGPDDGSVSILEEDEIRGYLIAGRQIVTAEKLEILALGRDFEAEDGQSAEDTLENIRQHGAIPVLSWSPGKWFFKRGQIINRLLHSQQPGSLLIGDTAMRPTLWPLPILMRKAQDRGFSIISGSDPLPLTGEEQLAGSFGFEIDAIFDPINPAASIRQILNSFPSDVISIGSRSGTWKFLNRWFRNFRRTTSSCRAE